MITLSLAQARRVAVAAQLLSGPRPTGIVETVEHLGGLQLDPTNAVARSELLVLWSRLGAYDTGELRRLLFDERRLFEYWAYIVPASDYGLHRETMRRYPRGDTARAVYIREWLQANAGFRRSVLDRLRRHGPLRSRDLEDRAVVPWRTGGWNDGKNLGRMLDILWFGGRIATAGRDGNERLWDLAERVLPVAEPRLRPAEVARRICEKQLRWRGVARPDQFGSAFDGRPPGSERALRGLVGDGVAVPVAVEWLAGEWYAHAEALEAPFAPRTTLLSPFDKLVLNRERTKELFGFRFRLEIYVPRAKREYGYFVLPILHGDRLIGRIDPLYDREARRLRVHAVHAEPDAPADAGPAVAHAIGELADWLGAVEIDYGAVPKAWRRDLR
jgi:uncharacterized protein YcaQ